MKWVICLRAKKNNINSELSSCSEPENEDVPQFAANPYVRLPPHLHPIPAPRTSLDVHETSVNKSLNEGAGIGNNQDIEKGCDSDSTLDRPLHPQGDQSSKDRSRTKRQRRGRDWSVPENEDTDQWSCSPTQENENGGWHVKETSDDCQSVSDSEVQLNFVETDDNISILTDGVAQLMMY